MISFDSSGDYQMKVISVMQVRKRLGEILDNVNLKAETYILERAGKPIAKLSPINADNPRSAGDLRLKVLKDLKGLNAGTDRGKNPDGWLNDERREWE